MVLDTRAGLADDSQLVRTARETPVLVAVGEASPSANRSRLSDAGCEVFVCEGETPAARLDALLRELGRRRLTNVLVEGGGRLLGSLTDARQIDEVRVFVAPRLFGGGATITGEGVATVSEALQFETPEVRRLGDDLCIRARVMLVNAHSRATYSGGRTSRSVTANFHWRLRPLLPRASPDGRGEPDRLTARCWSGS